MRLPFHLSVGCAHRADPCPHLPSPLVGDTYEASSILLQTLTKRVFADLAAKNVERVKSRLLPYPAIKEAWTMGTFEA